MTHPQLANEWCYAKNKAFHPEEIRATCCDGVWWDCPNGHPEYWMVIRNRAQKGCGCPICRRIEVNRAKKCSILDSPLKDWIHPTKNKEVNLELIPKTSPLSLYWLCRQGHEFKRTVSYQVKQMNCPLCLRETKKTTRYGVVFFIEPTGGVNFLF